MAVTKQNIDVIKKLIEIGIILQSKYKYLINEIDDYDIDKQYDLCSIIYERWIDVSDNELKVRESILCITKFMNNEIDIVSDIIMPFIIIPN